MANRVWLGNAGGSTFVFRISKPGNNVLTANESQLLFSESFKGWQFIQTGTVTFPDATGLHEATINYANRGITPYIVFYRCTSANNNLFDPSPFGDFAETRVISITNTQATFQAVTPQTVGRYIRYILLFGSLA